MKVNNDKNEKITLYEMVMEFEVTLGLKELNSFTELMGFSEKTGITGQTVTLTQTVPFIPDDEYLRKVESILKEKYSTEKFNILDCHFRGYKKFKAKEIDTTELKQQQEKEQNLEDERNF